MISPDPATAANEILATLEDAAALSACAESALNAGDSEEVLRLLSQRAVLLRSNEAAFSILGRAEISLGEESGEVAALVQAVSSAARRFQSDDERLRVVLESERDRIGRELEQVESDGAVRSAYGKQTRDSAKINLVR